MRALGAHISLKDMTRLAGNQSAAARADIAGKVAATLSAGAFNERETHLALDILRVLVRDIESKVRQAISSNLRDCLTVPHDVVLELARDEVPEVAVPLLRYSYILSEEDLVEIVRATKEVAKLVAVAGRDSISADLSDALVETQVNTAIKVLLGNKGAIVREQTISNHWESLSADRGLLEVMVDRGGLSPRLAEKLYSAVSDEMKTKLSKMYRLPMILAEEASEDAREWATLGLALAATDSPHVSDGELEALVEQLYAGNRLTYSLIIRSLCIGDLRFFEAALAKLADVPRINARILMFDSGDLGFKSLYDRAHMPEGFFEAISMLLRISLEETNYGRLKRDDFRSRVIARIQSAGYHRTIENMQYLLTIVGGKIASAEALH